MTPPVNLAPVVAPVATPAASTAQAPDDASQAAPGFGQLLAQQMRQPEARAEAGAEEDTQASTAPTAEAASGQTVPPQAMQDQGLALALGLPPLHAPGSQVSALARDPLAREALPAITPGNGLAWGQRTMVTGPGAAQGRALPHAAGDPAALAAETDLAQMPATELATSDAAATLTTGLGEMQATDQAPGLPNRADHPVSPGFGAMLHGMARTAAESIATRPEATATLHAPVGHPAWNDELGATLSWMASGKTQVAQLHLNPAELGPVSVTLTLQQDQAQAQFASAQPLVREALEAALPRLREMLAESGITLGQASVDAHAPNPQAGGHGARSEGGRPSADNPSGSGAPAPAPTLRAALGLVDTFA